MCYRCCTWTSTTMRYTCVWCAPSYVFSFYSSVLLFLALLTTLYKKYWIWYMCNKQPVILGDVPNNHLDESFSGDVGELRLLVTLQEYIWTNFHDFVRVGWEPLPQPKPLFPKFHCKGKPPKYFFKKKHFFPSVTRLSYVYCFLIYLERQYGFQIDCNMSNCVENYSGWMDSTMIPITTKYLIYVAPNLKI